MVANGIKYSDAIIPECISSAISEHFDDDHRQFLECSLGLWLGIHAALH